MRTASRRLTALLAGLVAASSVLAAHAAEPSKVIDSPRRSVADADDPLNRYVARQTVDGLVVAVTIDGPNVTLDQATPARVRKAPRKAAGKGDFAPVTAVGYAGGVQISQVAVPDSVMRALDDWNTPHTGGIVRVTKRQVVIPLAAARALDTVEVTAPATGAHARLDVRAAYADYCAAGQRAQARENPMCPPGGAGPPPANNPPGQRPR